MKCPNCNQEISESAAFCGYCGTHLNPPPGSSEPRKPDNADLLAEKDTSNPNTHANATTLPPEVSAPNLKRGSIWTAWLLMILGWGLAGLTASAFKVLMIRTLDIYDWIVLPAISGLILCGFGSLLTLLAFRKIGVTLLLRKNLLFVGGWLVIGMLMGWFTIRDGDYYGTYFLGNMMFFMLGGAFTGFLLIKNRNFTKHGLITLIWFIGSLPGALIAALTRGGIYEYHPVFGSNGYIPYPFSFNLPGGLLIGAICGGLTLLVFRWMLQQTDHRLLTKPKIL